MESEVCRHKYLSSLDIGLCCLSCGTIRSFLSDPSITKVHNLPDSEGCDIEYEHEPLETPWDTIRLLVLLAGKKSDPVSCRITSVGLDEQPAYIAISYTWTTECGDSSRTRKLRIYPEHRYSAWKPFRVTANCEAALRQVRDPRLERLVWIDSVCIDQTCISERNQQVSIMDRIYSQALQVDVCIRAPSQEFPELMKFLRAGDLPSYFPTGLGQKTHFTSGLPLMDMVQPANCPRSDENLLLRQVLGLFSMKYFSRAWVIQEVALSRMALLHLDEDVAPFDIRKLQILCDLLDKTEASSPCLSRWTRVGNVPTSFELAPWLCISMQSSASDPRDLVFAITGLLSFSTRAMISIDYMLSVEQVFRQAVAICLLQRHDLAIIEFAVLPREADLNVASTFSMENLRDCFAHLHNLDRIFGRVLSLDSSFELSHRLVPQGQLLPCLRVRASKPEYCTNFTSHKSFIQPMTRRVDSDIIQLVRNQYAEELGKFAGHNCSKLPSTCLWAETFFSQEHTSVLTHNNLGFTKGHCLLGDFIVSIGGATHPFLLRKFSPSCYRIVGVCHMWASKKPEDVDEDFVVFDGETSTTQGSGRVLHNGQLHPYFELEIY